MIQRAWAITPLLALVASALPVLARSRYPDRPIRLIIPFDALFGATEQVTPGQIVSDGIARPRLRERGLQPREGRPLHQGRARAMGADHQGDWREARMTAALPAMNSKEISA